MFICFDWQISKSEGIHLVRKDKHRVPYIHHRVPNVHHKPDKVFSFIFQLRN